MSNIVNKGRIIRSVSVTKEHDALIDELGLNCSTILRARLDEICENSSNLKKALLEKDEKITRLIKEVQELHQKIEDLTLNGGKKD